VYLFDASDEDAGTSGADSERLHRSRRWRGVLATFGGVALVACVALVSQLLFSQVGGPSFTHRGPATDRSLLQYTICTTKGKDGNNCNLCQPSEHGDIPQGCEQAFSQSCACTAGVFPTNALADPSQMFPPGCDSGCEPATSFMNCVKGIGARTGKMMKSGNFGIAHCAKQLVSGGWQRTAGYALRKMKGYDRSRTS